MSDLISREALIKAFETQNKVYRPNGLWHITGIEAIIKNVPPVEAVPVVHGEWIKAFKSMVPNLSTGKLEPKYSCDCSICKWHTGNQGTRFNFCPNCGADMRKKV